MQPLKPPARDYSQWGEQAMIFDALDKLPERDGWCVDIGAGDGVTLSNTRALVESGYNAVLIESNPSKVNQLFVHSTNIGKSQPIRATVGRNEGNRIDDILAGKTVAPPDFDFLSIDIDGMDYWVWADMSKYKPKLIMVEFNPTMDETLEFIQQPDATTNTGSSLLAIVRMANALGYELIATTATNALFVEQEYFDRFGIRDNSIRALWTDRRFMSWVFYDYTGRACVTGFRESPWTINAPATPDI